jgi:hypothetical protein
LDPGFLVGQELGLLPLQGEGVQPGGGFGGLFGGLYFGGLIFGGGGVEAPEVFGVLEVGVAEKSLLFLGGDLTAWALDWLWRWLFPIPFHFLSQMLCKYFLSHSVSLLFLNFLFFLFSNPLLFLLENGLYPDSTFRRLIMSWQWTYIAFVLLLL